MVKLNGILMTYLHSNSSRRIDNKFNILEGLFRNYLFIAITTIMIGVQVLIIFIGGETFSVTRLTPAQWAICIVLGVLCIPLGFVIRLISDEFLDRRARALEGASEALLRRVRRRASVVV
jgi:P-type Ca2+ transporter type 2C